MMIDPKNLTFNLVFTRNSPKYLWPITLSILKHTRLNLRLVANGCTTYDIAFLKEKVNRNQKLSLVIYPSKTVAWHDTILNYLLKSENSDYFCFMDTDILATGNFIQPFIKEMFGHRALFSCKPIWSENDTLPSDYPQMLGKFIYSENGLCLGNSYFAIYHKETLENIIEKYGLHFNRTRWQNLSVDVQHILEEENLKKDLYDTGKVLNILMQHEGHKVCYLDSDNLYHIGGLSWYLSRVKKRISLAREERKVLKKTDDDLKKIIKLRLNVNQFFYAFIRSLINKKRIEETNSEFFDEILKIEEVKKIREEIINIYQEYYTSTA